MFYKAILFIAIMFTSLASALAQEAVKAPSCLRVTSSTDTDATIQFEPHGGETFEAERYYNGRWTKYKAAIVTTGAKHSLTVPLSNGLINIVRVCAITATDRACASEGVYAKR